MKIEKLLVIINGVLIIICVIAKIIIEILREIIPRIGVLAYQINPTGAYAEINYIIQFKSLSIFLLMVGVIALSIIA